jgi:hypothetical protein
MANQTTVGNLSPETTFVYKNETYRKTADVRVSCCRKINAVKLTNGEQTYIPDNELVEIQ